MFTFFYSFFVTIVVVVSISVISTEMNWPKKKIKKKQIIGNCWTIVKKNAILFQMKVCKHTLALTHSPV